MATLIRAPKTSENTEELTVGKWYVQVGQTVAQDQPLCQLITDKAAFDMPCEKAAGTVLVRSSASVGSVIPVGHILVAVGDPGESGPEIASENAALDAARTGRAVSEDSTAASVRATPKARRLAKEKNVNLAAVKVKLGIDGAITPEDVERFLSDGA
ncbi:MAG: biotin/lipoyl-containing protein [Planctomycetota bacterium]